jgi:hypothetical protein
VALCVFPLLALSNSLGVTQRIDMLHGAPADTCSLEATHRVMKAEGNFDSVEGVGTVMERAVQVGMRLSRDMPAFVTVPPVPRTAWKSGQKLWRKGWANLGYKLNNTFVLPSEKLLETMPEGCDTIDKKKQYIKRWSNEYIAMRRNPRGYYKLTDGSWDFDILTDMMFSFWVLTPIDPEHQQYHALLEAGIAFTCNCPQFNHYFQCKHCLALGLFFQKIKVPDKFSDQPVGKHKAPAGVSLKKRGHCLAIDL